MGAKLVPRLASLLTGYSEHLKQLPSSHQDQLRLTNLLRGFLAARKNLHQIETVDVQSVLPSLKRVLDGYRGKHAAWAESQKVVADDFNLFEVLEVEYDELSHSKLLAWLLDRRIEHGTHAQGSLGFQLFLEELRPELDPDSKFQIADYAAEPRYWVRREVSSAESRVDIEIAASGNFIIHIENKILATEGEDQTEREWTGLNERADQLGIPQENRHAIFLTLDGRPPADEHFRPVGWDRIAAVLSRFAGQVRPRYVRLFTRHYAEAVRKLAASSYRQQEILYDEAVVQ
jgi:hypothetical protein